VRDTDANIRKNFTGLNWHGVDSHYRVRGKFTRHAKPITVKTMNTLGDIETYTNTGYVTLTVAGTQIRMLQVNFNNQFWFIIRNLTSGQETYSAARFLYTDAPDAEGWTATWSTTRPARLTHTRRGSRSAVADVPPRGVLVAPRLRLTRVEVQQAACTAGFKQSPIDTGQDLGAVGTTADGCFPAHHLETGRLSDPLEGGRGEEPQVVQRRVVPPALGLQPQSTLPALESRA